MTTLLTNAILDTTPQSGDAVALDFIEQVSIYNCESQAEEDGNISILSILASVIWDNVPGRVNGAYFGSVDYEVDLNKSPTTNNTKSLLPTIYLDDPTLNPS